MPDALHSPRKPAIAWTPALRRLLLAIGCVFCLLVAFQIHGFSLGVWHQVIGDSPPTETLIGQPREERWDDWVVQLPMALAQGAQDPSFPLVNTDIGLGQNMLVPIPMPTRGVVALFHPTLWGFFLGRDTGLSWMWWTQALGLFTVWLLVLLVLTRNRLGLASAGSALLCFAPLMQFYSFNAAPFAISMGISWLAAVGIATASRRRYIVACGLLLGWGGGCFASTLYPPYQIVLAQLFLVLAAGFGVQRRSELDLRDQAATRALALGLATAVVAVAAGALYVDAKDAIEVLRNTEYPGRRVAIGGAMPYWKLLATHIWIPRHADADGPLGRFVSSAASFLLFWPPLALASAWRAIRDEGARDPLLFGVIGYCAALSIWCAWGLPTWLAHASALDLVPAERAVLGLGFGDAVLLVVFLAQAAPARDSQRRVDLALALAWTALLTLAAAPLRAALPAHSLLWLALVVAANGLLVFGLLQRWHPVLLTAAAATGLAVATAWFNPLVVGGSAYLVENPVSRMVAEVDRSAGGKTVWVTYGDARVPNLFRVLGIRALDGAQPVPQLALWRRIDPSPVASASYNRFAHVSFMLPRAHVGRFASLADVLALYVDPTEDVLPSLGVTHLLVRLDTGPVAQYFRDYESIARAGSFVVFELPLRRKAER